MSRLHQFLQSRLAALSGWVYRRAGLILIVATLLTIVSAIVVYRGLKVINDTNALIRETSPVHRNYLEYKKEFGVEEDYVVVIRSDDPDQNRAIAREIGAGLETMKPEVAKVLYHFNFDKLEKHFLLYLDEKDLLDIEKEVGGYAQAMSENHIQLNLNSVLDEVNRRFDEKYLRQKKNWAEFKPFIDHFIDILNKLADQIEGKTKPKSKNAAPTGEGSAAAQDRLGDLEQAKTENEYLSFDGGKMILVLATPGPAEEDSMSPHSEGIAKVRAFLDKVRSSHQGVEIGLTGEPVLGDDELRTSTEDSTHASILTFILISILFFVGYRALTRPGLALLTLIMALVWSLAFTVVTVGHLNIISQAFVVMILGLGIDFGIQIMGRYEEELARGAGIQKAIELSLKHTGLAVLIGASTTAAAFYTMCFNDFIGLAELGVIAGSGILICLVAYLIVQPAFYVWWDRRTGEDILKARAAASKWSSPEWINKVLFGAPRTVLVVMLLLSAVAAAGYKKIQFDYNLLHLQNPALESVRVEHELVKSPAASVIYGVMMVDNLDEARQKIAQLQKLPSVGQVHSLTDFFPERQQEKMVIIRRITGALKKLNLNTDVSKQVDVKKARLEIANLLDQSKQAETQAKHYVGISQMARDAVEIFGKLIPPLERAQNAMQNLSQDELGRRLNRYQTEVFGTMQNNLAFLANQDTEHTVQAEDIPPELLQRYRSPSGKILIEVYPKNDIWEREANVEFVRDIRSVDPKATGTPVQNYEYIELLRTSYVNAAIWAFVAIIILISLHFWSIRDVVFTIIPLLLTVIWTMGIMGWFGLKFNPANIITLPLVIGIGVAFGVYTVERFREDQKMDLFSNSTGKSIAFSAMNTMIGFGSLLISSYRGLQSLGLLMFIGVGMCLIGSLFILPQIMKLIRK